jgi:hypothetical protein
VLHIVYWRNFSIFIKKKMNNIYYIYFHINPLTNKVFYVGKGKLKRAFDRRKRSDYWNNVVNKYGYIVDIVHSNLSEEKAFELEIMYIKRFGIKNLVNSTIGGSGGDTISLNPNRDIIVEKQKKYANDNRELLSKRAKDAWTPEFRKNQIEKQSKNPLMAIDLETGFPIFAINSKDLSEQLKVKHSTLRTAKCYNYNLKHRYIIKEDLLEEF